MFVHKGHWEHLFVVKRHHEVHNYNHLYLDLPDPQVVNTNMIIQGALSFNQPITLHNTGNVRDMRCMFKYANGFNLRLFIQKRSMTQQQSQWDQNLI